MRVRSPLAVAALLFASAACGGDDSSGATQTSTTTDATPTSTTTEPTGEPEATRPTTTIAPAPTTIAPAPTTTMAAEPTAATTTEPAPTTTTTTLPPDVHPVFGLAWDEFLPDPAASAVYRVDMLELDNPMSHVFNVAGDLDARMEYGVEWFGHEGTYDRLVFGFDGPGEPGLILYFHLDQPWVVQFIALEAWPVGNTGRGPEAVETFAEPVDLDFSGLPGEASMVHGDLTAIGPFGVEELEGDLVLTLRDADAGPVTVAAGTFEKAMVYDLMLYGRIVGGEYPVEITISPENLLLLVSMPGASIELLQPWR